MDSTRVSSWLQVAANLAILAGIALVWIQVQQANDLTAAQLGDANIESSIAKELALAGESPAESLYRVMTAQRPLRSSTSSSPRESITRYFGRSSGPNHGIAGPGEHPCNGTAVGNRYVFTGEYGRSWLRDVATALEASSEPLFAEGVAPILRMVDEQLEQDPPTGHTRARIEAFLARSRQRALAEPGHGDA